MRPRHDTIGSLTAAKRLRHEFTPRPAKSAKRSRLRISVRDAARELHGWPRAVLQWAEPRYTRCTALNRLGEPCRAARMRDHSTCFRHSGGSVEGARLIAARLSGDLDRIQRAEMDQNAIGCVSSGGEIRASPAGRLCYLADEAFCRAWAARQGFSSISSTATSGVLDACRWIWARKSRGLIRRDD